MMNPTLSEKPAARDVFIAGLIASQIAALIMAVVIMIVFPVFLGRGPLYPVQVIGSTVYGEAALAGFHLPALVAGLVLHMLVALAWGVVFSIAAGIVDVRTAAMAAIVGVVVATVSMVDSYVFVPYVMVKLHGTDIWNREVPMFWNWAAHMVFGAAFAFYPGVLAWLSNMKHATAGHIAAR